MRYGIDGENYGAESFNILAALGLTTPPLPIPSAVLSLFARGPTLSRADALLAHDGLAPDPQAGRRIGETP